MRVEIWLADPLGSPLTLYRVAVAWISVTHFGGDEYPASQTHFSQGVVVRAPSTSDLSVDGWRALTVGGNARLSW